MRNFWFLLTSIFVLKLLVAFAFTQARRDHSPEKVNPYAVYIANDYSEHLGPVDNYFEHDVFASSNDLQTPYAGRLPGYSFAYLLIRFVTDQDEGLFVLILFQILLSALATLRAAQLLQEATRKKWVFWASIVIIGFVQFLLPWESVTLPESFALSCWLLSLYHFKKALQNGKTIDFILCGLLGAWMFFLRGFLAPYLLIIGLIFLWNWYKNGRSLVGFKKLVLFVLPFVVFVFSWGLRNKISLGEWIFTQTSMGYSTVVVDRDLGSMYKPSMLELRKLIASWGGDNVHYYPNTEMAYFSQEKAGNLFPFPDDIYFEGFNKDSVVNIRHLVLSSFDENKSRAERLHIESQIAEKSKLYLAGLKEAHPTTYYFTSRVRRVENLIVQNVVGNWPGKSFNENNLLYKFVKLLVLGLYGFGVVGGFLLGTWLMFKTRDPLTILLFWSSISLVLIFAFPVNVSEFKYFSTASTSLTILMIWGIANVLSLPRALKPN